MATGVVSTDASGIVTTVNRAASRMLGVAPTAAVGRHYAVAFGAPSYLDLVTLIGYDRPAMQRFMLDFSETILALYGLSQPVVESRLASR